MKMNAKNLLIGLVVFISCLLAYYQFWFLRQPERQIPQQANAVIAPANGKIVSVTKYNTSSVDIPKEEAGLINVWTTDVDTAGTVISIQMDVTNVHYQRAPFSGKVVNEKYTTGAFNNAVVMSNSYGIRFENEHNETLLENENGKRLKVVQIAGFLARKIVDFVNPGQQVKAGDVIGLIKLGSQVTIILPHDAVVNCKTGDVTIDGETILATYE